MNDNRSAWPPPHQELPGRQIARNPAKRSGGPLKRSADCCGTVVLFYAIASARQFRGAALEILNVRPRTGADSRF